MNKYLVFLLMSVLCACSSAPETPTNQNEYTSLANSWYVQAQRNRQLDKNIKALHQYTQAEHYAKLKNNNYLIGVIKLKQAVILLEQNQIKQAEQLIFDVDLIYQFESPDLEVALLASRVKLNLAKGQYSQAKLNLTRILKSKPLTQSREKQIYYTWWQSEISNKTVDEQTQNQDLTYLSQRFMKRELKNIEIYSYVLIKRLEHLVKNQRPQAKVVFQTAIQHFSDLELPNKLAQCYMLISRYYSLMEQPEAAVYFKNKAKNNFSGY